ncbi:MAG TPA: hypothetical protein ENN07_02715, partial [candidate division Zixibacteria bacterium]|nr:hypothetical protein [candidate division Zixibacteria bacterium]
MARREWRVGVIDPRFGTAITVDIPERLSLAVSDIDIDEWDNVWIVTDDGAGMFRSADSTWHAIKTRYNDNAEPSEMTDLPTDYLYSVKVDPSTGDVWFAGEGGIGILTTGFAGEGDDLPELLPFPNPFVWDGTAVARATISGVPPDADLHIYSADGQLIRTITGAEKGPTAAVEWDARNSDGSPVASGIYILVAPSSRGIA